jgi:PIN domain nuclease of toxin-antitoxin system
VRVLLDTHILAWAVGQPESLSSKVRELLEHPETQPLVSAVSIWEMSIKHNLGKWPEVEPFMNERLYGNFLEQLGASELAISSRHTRLAGQFDVNHKDPFDRLLVAQAVLENIPVLSKDEALDLFPVTRIW